MSSKGGDESEESVGWMASSWVRRLERSERAEEVMSKRSMAFETYMNELASYFRHHCSPCEVAKMKDKKDVSSGHRTIDQRWTDLMIKVSLDEEIGTQCRYSERI